MNALIGLYQNLVLDILLEVALSLSSDASTPTFLKPFASVLHNFSLSVHSFRN